MDSEILEARFGLKVAAHLSMAAQDLPHDISERLRVARQQAVAQARSRALSTRRHPVSAEASPRLNLSGGVAGLGWQGRQGDPWWLRLVSIIPAVLLVLGLLAASEWQQQEELSAAADIDVALLGDDLPPDAYSDPGFAEFLQSPPGNSLQ
ncbi:uncharacterized protein DUF3619 [Sphaerotilus hippei]|uniref:Uncharacterized protein DUF3619 n=1 Tax=Sphaerotilus hippei TaxID=744406 RepID=A0A318H4D7_9BURK|nr:DUF3619 family protein [Sphaerotilus hippei]PXW98601.1 uncharacterized protein DUF3619 [Sphaerotilus hippei]